VLQELAAGVALASRFGLRRAGRVRTADRPTTSPAAPLLYCLNPPRPPRSQVQPMPAQLLALTDGPSILLDKPILLLGRHGECDVQLNSRKVSRRHCCIAQVRDFLVVRVLGSTNGVRSN